MHVRNTKDFKCSGETLFQPRHCTEFVKLKKIDRKKIPTQELAVDFEGVNYLAITRLVLRKRLGRVNGAHLSLRSCTR